MERFFDELVGYVRAIEVAGIDVVDTESNNLAQDRDCTVVICWRPEYMRTSQLHGAVAHSSEGQIIGELECASGQDCGHHRLPLGFHVRVCHRKPPGAAMARSSTTQGNTNRKLVYEKKSTEQRYYNGERCWHWDGDVGHG